MSGFGIALVAAAVAVVVLALWWFVPKLQARGWSDLENKKERIELEDKARGTVGQLIGAIGLVATVAITLTSVVDARRSADESRDLTRATQTTENFARAIDQLGARDGQGRPATEIRLGGIYLLEQFVLGQGEPEKRAPSAIPVLAAYLRANAPRRARFKAGPLPAEAPCEPGRRPMRPDVAAALAVLRRLPRNSPPESRRTPVPLDLAGTDLAGADLRDTDLRGANLRGARLFMAHLENAHLEGADLRGVDARSACFRMAHAQDVLLSVPTRALGISSPDEQEARASAATLRGASLAGIDLQRAEMSYVDLRYADVAGGNFTAVVAPGRRIEGVDTREIKAGAPALCRDPDC